MKQMSFDFDEKTARLIEELAQEEGISESEVVKKAIQDYMETIKSNKSKKE